VKNVVGGIKAFLNAEAGANRDGVAEPVSPTRVLVATVAENRSPFVHEAEFLFRSLRRFGGNLSHAPGVVYFVGSADPAVIKRLAALGVTTKVVEPFDERCPHANKIRMLQTEKDFEYLVALDPDIVVARDFSAHVMGAAVAAKPGRR
jgi:hypothetical protein